VRSVRRSFLRLAARVDVEARLQDQVPHRPVRLNERVEVAALLLDDRKP
jgi:hypothetical protein